MKRNKKSIISWIRNCSINRKKNSRKNHLNHKNLLYNLRIVMQRMTSKEKGVDMKRKNLILMMRTN